MKFIYDTNILLQILRRADSAENVLAKVGSGYLEECISIVTVAEIRSLSIQFNWGDARLNKMRDEQQESDRRLQGFSGNVYK